jgi:hypothetical protein
MILLLAFIGSITGLFIWLIVYEINKTSAIEFDGPAVYGMILSAIAGIIIFSLTSLVISFRKK